MKIELTYCSETLALEIQTLGNHPKERIQQEVNSFYFQNSKHDNCSNYRGITLLNSGYKTYAKIIAQCFKTISETVLLEEQNGFRIGRSCVDNVFIINLYRTAFKQIMEKRREFNLETHMAFLDLEKAFDRVDRNQLWQILNRRGIPYHLIEVIKSPYKNTSVHIDTGKKILEKIYINQGVQQGCNLSPTIFNIYIDDLLRNWKHKVDAGIVLKRNLYLNTLLFADDQVIIQDSEDKLQKSVCMLNQMSKGYNLKISTDKTKIMAFKGKHIKRFKTEIDGSILEQVKRFNYLGCELSLDGDPDFDKKNKQIPKNMRHYQKTFTENSYRHPNEIL